MSANHATEPETSPIEVLKQPETLMAAAAALGVPMTNEILQGVTENLNLLESHHAKISEVLSPQ
ncbi:MAG: hypothetical protein CMK07_06090 [Ponticaulis sp.]|nr:hypothetical protein [Ponticaulis sp.]